jgi:hypothetical protein
MYKKPTGFSKKWLVHFLALRRLILLKNTGATLEKSPVIREFICGWTMANPFEK